MITNTNQSEANQGTILHITAYHSNGKGKHSKDEHRGAIDFLGDFREPRATRDGKAKQGYADKHSQQLNAQQTIANDSCVTFVGFGVAAQRNAMHTNAC